MDLTMQLREDGEIITERLDHWAAIAAYRPFFHYGEDGMTLTYADFACHTDVIAGNLAANGVAARPGRAGAAVLARVPRPGNGASGARIRPGW